MFSLAIDFFDEFGLERLTEPEKPLNEMSSDCKYQLDKRTSSYQTKVITEQKQSESISKPHPSAPGVINIACEG